MTVRRDLESLERSGGLRRVHGGAASVFLSAEETPYGIRALESSEAKATLGAAAASLLADGETVILDGGTTAMEVARALRSRRLTVMPLASGQSSSCTSARTSSSSSRAARSLRESCR